jgi:DNA-binding CsgD family transcriptional regulator
MVRARRTQEPRQPMGFDQTTQSAILQVIQPGSRASFRRRVVDALRSLVPAPGAFFCFGTHDARAYVDSTRLVEGNASTLRGTDGVRLTKAFGFEAKSVVETPRRAYLAIELWPDDERMKLPYFAEHSAKDGLTQAIVVFAHEGGVLFGLAGLERRAGDPPFSREDCERLETLAPFIVTASRSQMSYDELTREAAAIRALGKVSGTLYVVDRDKGKVAWAINRDRGLDWDHDVTPIEELIVQATEQSLAARAKGDALPPTPPRLPEGTVMGVAKLEGDPVFGAAKCAVLRVEPQDRPGGHAAMEGLSKREREIARLLVAGYSGVNVAAIAGLSENTVRTYVRRLYMKLGVNNRADLVRKLVAPEPASAAPSSQIAPPPDSSLVDGDDTLD